MAVQAQIVGIAVIAATAGVEIAAKVVETVAKVAETVTKVVGIAVQTTASKAEHPPRPPDLTSIFDPTSLTTFTRRNKPCL